MNDRDIIDNKISLNISSKDFYQFINISFFQLTKLTLKTIAFFSPQIAAKLAWKIFTTPRQKRKPRQSFIESMSIEQVNYQGHNINTYIQNSKESRAILLVHGWEGQASNFVALLLSLLDHRYKVISFDSPAHGLSQGKSVNAVDYSNIIQKLAQKHGPFEAIIGHSMGGFASAHALAHSPSHIADKLITIGAPNKLSTIIHNFIKFMDLSFEVEMELLKFVRKQFDLNIEQASTAEYSKIASSTKKLYIHDEYDREVPIERLSEMLDLNPDAQVHRTYALGHSRILKDSQTIEKIVDFINS